MRRIKQIDLLNWAIKYHKGILEQRKKTLEKFNDKPLRGHNMVASKWRAEADLKETQETLSTLSLLAEIETGIKEYGYSGGCNHG